MKLLTLTQTQTVSGAIAYGDYYVDGVSHPFKCDLINQVCLDSLLSYLQNTNPTLNMPVLTIDEAVAKCGSELGLVIAAHCLEPVIAKIAANERK
jgi:hypothetical protein